MEEKIIIAETERLLLRRYIKSDLQDLYEYLSNSRVVKYELRGCFSRGLLGKRIRKGKRI